MKRSSIAICGTILKSVDSFKALTFYYFKLNSDLTCHSFSTKIVKTTYRLKLLVKSLLPLFSEEGKILWMVSHLVYQMKLASQCIRVNDSRQQNGVASSLISVSLSSQKGAEPTTEKENTRPGLNEQRRNTYMRV